MRALDLRFSLIALVALAGCAGGASGTAAIPPQAQAVSRAPLSNENSAKQRVIRYAGSIVQQTPVCATPAACVGIFTMTVTSDGTNLAGTWTSQHFDPLSSDNGTFSGQVTGPNTFSGRITSSVMPLCIRTLGGKMTPGMIDATYAIGGRVTCDGAIGAGEIVLHHLGNGEDGGDGDHDGD